MSCRTGSTCRDGTRTAYGQIRVRFDGASVLPTADLRSLVPAKNISAVKATRQLNQLAAGECAAYEVEVLYDDKCFFVAGLPPLLQVSTCAPGERNFDAIVKPMCDISNSQAAFFRVALRGPTEASCYPECAGSDATQPVGQVNFNIVATQGSECR